MCIAIAKQAGVAIQEEILETCFDANPDGAGFCIEQDGVLEVYKGYFTFKEFMDAFKPYENEKALIHFRIKTHGKIDQENCHPFLITDDLAFIHNGIISNARYDTSKSDTRTFKEDVLQPIIDKYGQDVLTDPIFQHLIEKYIGGSKLAMMKQGEDGFIFFNKQLGNESKEGIWFSNYSWQKKAPVVYTPQSPSHPYTYGRKQWDMETSKTKKEVPKLECYNGEFSFGTIVRVKYDVKTDTGILDKGKVGEVEFVWSDNTIDIDFYPEGKFEGVSPYALEILDSAEAFYY